MLKNHGTSYEYIQDIGTTLASRYNRTFEIDGTDASNGKPEWCQNCVKAIDRLLDMTLRYDLTGFPYTIMNADG